MTVHKLIEELQKIPNQNREVLLIVSKLIDKFGYRVLEEVPNDLIIITPPRSTDRVEVWLSQPTLTGLKSDMVIIDEGEHE